MSTIDKLHKCNTSSELKAFLSNLDLHVKKSGGRTFVLKREKTDKNPVTLNQIVKQYNKIYSTESKKDNYKLYKLNAECGVRIWHLDKSSKESLKKLSGCIRFLTHIHQIFGNLSYNRKKVMLKISNDVHPSLEYLRLKRKETSPKQKKTDTESIPEKEQDEVPQTPAKTILKKKPVAASSATSSLSEEPQETPQSTKKKGVGFNIPDSEPEKPAAPKSALKKRSAVEKPIDAVSSEVPAADTPMPDATADLDKLKKKKIVYTNLRDFMTNVPLPKGISKQMTVLSEGRELPRRSDTITMGTQNFGQFHTLFTAALKSENMKELISAFEALKDDPVKFCHLVFTYALIKPEGTLLELDRFLMALPWPKALDAKFITLEVLDIRLMGMRSDHSIAQISKEQIQRNGPNDKKLIFNVEAITLKPEEIFGLGDHTQKDALTKVEEEMVSDMVANAIGLVGVALRNEIITANDPTEYPEGILLRINETEECKFPAHFLEKLLNELRKMPCLVQLEISTQSELSEISLRVIAEFEKLPIIPRIVLKEENLPEKFRAVWRLAKEKQEQEVITKRPLDLILEAYKE